MLTEKEAKILFEEPIDIDKIKGKIPKESHDIFKQRAKMDDDKYNDSLSAFLKYITVTSLLDKGRFIPVNIDADNVWHEFILQTEFYRNFCYNILPGKRFIDHLSVGFNYYKDKKDFNEEETIKHLIEWLGFHYGYFGPFTDDDFEYWSCLDFLKKEMNMNLDDINKHAEKVYVEMYNEKLKILKEINC
ncbi:hypothetical protein ACTHGC_003885 [Vibrio parahaemolyticus]|uniref:hypothetical protein n=2 Tax=Vibrio parahaemolyticus TaxID=670 RepID=UPI0006B25D6A|nr:hypothetical protein [Vibrio parahaemolyticus]EKO5218957.1 hypothetical protein [Vibrio parahaemolyticus]ELB2269062.1 hypothetical protein [Vibrio parahaemolyticus]KOY33256.1 hypothetical protein ACX08_14065 [Vibrio parahaemolyticus]MBM4860337.1 hypothetical protein [Vibrio parahaemolyticus]MBM5080986.1 hypothetical protein [Vibrio parahaemolyticus]